MDPSLFDDICSWPMERKLKEIEYIAGTIPSSWEFVDYTFLVTGVSRAYTHQQVRTRSASYAQQSMRVVAQHDYEYIYTHGNQIMPDAMTEIEGLNKEINRTYRKLLSIGQSVEDARGILPTNISTNIVCKFNLRNFTELFRSRSGGRTQNEYQQVIRAMADRVLEIHPWVETFLNPKGRDYFKDIEDFAQREYGGDLKKKGELLKIVDRMRKEQ